MEVTQEQYNKYLKYCNIITSGNNIEAQDLLHDVLLQLYNKIELKKLTPEQINDNLVFIIIRNLFLNNKNKEKTREFINNKLDDEVIDYYYGDVDLDKNELFISDRIIQDKLEVIEKIINKLPSYEKKLFYLHYIQGISQRKISRETGIGTMPIWYKLQSIKNKILEIYRDEQND
jgi:RNA polymerase sigma factor (sigma-70 family)